MAQEPTNTTTSLERLPQSLAFGAQLGYTAEYVQLIKDTVAKDATDMELAMFLEVCSSTKLNPLRKEIFFWKMSGKVIIHTSIQGRRVAAERTKAYAPGKPIKRNHDEQGKHISSTAYVKKFSHGTWHEIEETAHMNEWKKDSPFWNDANKASHQLDVTAERHALEKAFPQLRDIGDSEDLDNAIPMSLNGGADESSPEAIARREHLVDCLLKVGAIFCSPEQYTVLESGVNGDVLSRLETRHDSALLKLREYILSEIGQVFKGEKFGQFIVDSFPEGIDGASCQDLLKTLDVIKTVKSTFPNGMPEETSTDSPAKEAETGAAEPQEGSEDAQAAPENGSQPRASKRPKGAKTVENLDAEAISPEEAELIALREEIMEKVSVMADGDLEKIDDILDGRALNNMDKDRLVKFLASLSLGV